MKPGIDWYKYGVVTHIEDVDQRYINLTVLAEDTKEDLVMAMNYRDIEIWDEVEFIIGNEKTDTGKEYPNIIARHNISKDIKEKIHEKILFPTEIGFGLTREEWEERDLQKMHKLTSESKWIQKLYDRYTALIRIWSTTWWARDPFNPLTFKSTKLYMENARNIFFYYCSEKAKEMIREEFYKWNLDEWLFKSFIYEYYLLFVELTKRIPLPYQTVQEFENRFADIKYEVGL